jgi:hypothetical protein
LEVFLEPLGIYQALIERVASEQQPHITDYDAPNAAPVPIIVVGQECPAFAQGLNFGWMEIWRDLDGDGLHEWFDVFFLGNVNLIKDGVDCIPPVVPPNMISHQKMQAARWSDAGHSLESSAVCSLEVPCPGIRGKILRV